jgi:amidohydrolase
VGVRTGALTSACKSFQVVVRGRSGHSARPYEAVDPIPAAVNIVSLLYQLAPRSIDARSPLVLTVASIDSPVSFNAIPDEAVIRGTLRTTRLEDTDTVQRRMEKVVRSVADATGCSAELEFVHSCPPTNNHPRLIELMAAVAGDMLGPDSVRWLGEPSLGAEDFGFYQELIPGAIVRLGAAMPDPRQRRPLHSSLFDIDEAALRCGARLLTCAGLRAAATATEPLA